MAEKRQEEKRRDGGPEEWAVGLVPRLGAKEESKCWHRGAGRGRGSRGPPQVVVPWVAFVARPRGEGQPSPPRGGVRAPLQTGSSAPDTVGEGGGRSLVGCTPRRGCRWLVVHHP